MHVATTTRRRNGKVYHSHLLRRTYREGGKVKHQTLGNLSHLPPDLIEFIRTRLAQKNPPPVPSGSSPPEEAFEILRSLPHGHVAAVLGVMRQVGLASLLDARGGPESLLVLAIVAARILDPRSKLATLREWAPETAASTLGTELKLPSCEEEDLYSAMDWLLERQDAIESKLAKRHLTDGSLILYDVTSSFYTGSCCPLAAFGHNRDGKNGDPQIVYGLLTSREGCPVAVEVFPGNTGDPKTLSAQVRKVRRRFRLKRVVFVADRGLLTSKRIEEDLKEEDGLDWITALRAESIKALAEQEIIHPGLFDTLDLAEVQSEDFPNERLIVCKNPLLAERRAQKREALLKATEIKLETIRLATQRAKKPLRGKDKIGLRVGKVLGHFKVGKHFALDIEENAFTYRRDAEKIREEAQLDGLYVIRTSLEENILSAEDTVRAYKDLAKVERAFRSLKTVDLKVRPIFHHLEKRVRAHVFLCMLAYYVEWHMRQKLAPMLFEEEDKEGAEKMRTSVVAPAQRSPSAKEKDATKRTKMGEQAHSFQTLLKDLATLTKNQVRIRGGKQASFYLFSTPTPIQTRALELLGVTLKV